MNYLNDSEFAMFKESAVVATAKVESAMIALEISAKMRNEFMRIGKSMTDEQIAELEYLEDATRKCLDRFDMF